MKKSLMSRLWGLVAVLALTLSACESPEEELKPQFPEKITATVMAGDTFDFTIEPTMKWSLKIPSEVATYFKFIVGESERYTLNGDAGTHTITIAVAPNEEFDTTRTCAVEMTMGGESQIVVELTRGAKERSVKVYAAEFDTEEEMFVADEEGNFSYSTTATDKIEWVWCNEQWMQRIVVDANFRWSFGVDTPEWINASATSGSAGRTEIFLRTNPELLPLEDSDYTLEICDTSDRNGDGVIDSSDILIVATFATSMEGCKDVCEVELAAQATFNAEGLYYAASSESYVEMCYGRIDSPRGVELFAVTKTESGDYTREGAEWIILSVGDFPEEAGAEGIWTRNITLSVEATTSEQDREGAIVAIPLTQAGSTTYADFIVCDILQEGVEIIDTSDPVYAFDETVMMGFGARFEKMEKGSWPWINNWSGIPHAYKLTLRNNNSGDDLVFRRPFDSYKIYGIDGYMGATYDPSTCWLTISESDPEEAIENGYIIRSRLGTNEGEFTNTMAGAQGQNEATFVFFNDKGEAYALIYVILDPTFTPYEEVEGDVMFTNIEEALQTGAKLEKIVFGDAEYNEEEDYMGILQYRLTLNPKCKSISLTLPEYSMAYPYQSWITTRIKDGATIVSTSSSSSATGRITFYGSNNYNVVLQLIVVYNAN